MNYEIKDLPETVEQCRANLRLTIAALCSDKEVLNGESLSAAISHISDGCDLMTYMLGILSSVYGWDLGTSQPG